MDDLNFIEIRWRSQWYEQEVALRDRLLRAPLGLRFDAHELESEASDWHFGITTGVDRLIACVVAVPLSQTGVKLRQMAVETEYQRGGIGGRLVRQTEAVLRDRGVQTIELHARETAVGFYRKLGYQIDGERFVEVSLPHFRMIKQT